MQVAHAANAATRRRRGVNARSRHRRGSGSTKRTEQAQGVLNNACVHTSCTNILHNQQQQRQSPRWWWPHQPLMSPAAGGAPAASGRAARTCRHPAMTERVKSCCFSPVDAH